MFIMNIQNDSLPKNPEAQKEGLFAAETAGLFHSKLREAEGNSAENMTEILDTVFGEQDSGLSVADLLKNSSTEESIDFPLVLSMEDDFGAAVTVDEEGLNMIQDILNQLEEILSVQLFSQDISLKEVLTAQDSPEQLMEQILTLAGDLIGLLTGDDIDQTLQDTASRQNTPANHLRNLTDTAESRSTPREKTAHTSAGSRENIAALRSTVEQLSATLGISSLAENNIEAAEKNSLPAEELFRLIEQKGGQLQALTLQAEKTSHSEKDTLVSSLQILRKLMDEVDHEDLRHLNIRNTKNADAPLINNKSAMDLEKHIAALLTDKPVENVPQEASESAKKETGEAKPESFLSKALSGQVAPSEQTGTFHEGQNLSREIPLTDTGTAPVQENTAPAADKTITERIANIQILNQISHKISEAAQSGLSTIQLKLKPERLGEVQIRLSVQNDVVTARIDVENQQVRQIVENNFQALRDSLQDHNLSAGNLDVNVGDFSRDREDGSGYSRQAPPRRNGLASDEEEAEYTDPKTDTGRRFGTNSFEYNV
ncbi:MAG: flagellar hook-length control protein FliK [Fibrobacterota bacterium]